MISEISYGLSLCIQGTLYFFPDALCKTRFIPVHTGNTKKKGGALIPRAVYPCAYREHVADGGNNVLFVGLSLCIQGTLSFCSNIKPESRFIPVYTGNTPTQPKLSIRYQVYPCAYREHRGIASIQSVRYGLSLCIQGTLQL